jgi:hypothetical protein
VRAGPALLVEYKAAHHDACAALSKEYGVPMRLWVDGPSLDAAVAAAFVEVLAAQRADDARLAQQYADRVTRAEYEAQLAQRQYLAADPDHRLVAAELERRWEVALRALAEAREAAERFARAPAAPALDPTLREPLRDLGARLPELWDSGRLTPATGRSCCAA